MLFNWYILFPVVFANTFALTFFIYFFINNKTKETRKSLRKYYQAFSRHHLFSCSFYTFETTPKETLPFENGESLSAAPLNKLCIIISPLSHPSCTGRLSFTSFLRLFRVNMDLSLSLLTPNKIHPVCLPWCVHPYNQ